MMNRSILLPIFVVFTLSAGALGDDDAALEAQARAVVEEFVGLLRPQLQGALQSGGPAHAVAVCADIAPQIADSLSASSGWLVKRVSLGVRNASRAEPDPWERGVLEEFERRQARGETAGTLHLGRRVGGHYRYLQAQIVEPVCLVCHGVELGEPVKEALELYYPDDEATGYALGEVRGAISLSRPLEAARSQ